MKNYTYISLVGLTLFVMSGDILFTNGFMLLRIPPIGAGVPINEVLLAIICVAILFSRQSVAMFQRNSIFAPLFLLWMLSFIQLLSGVLSQGTWAIRDSANIIETGFLFAGYCLASDCRFLSIFTRWMKALFGFAAFYILLYPAQGLLVRFSPTIPSMSGYQAPLFFSYGNPASVGITAACQMILSNSRHHLFQLCVAAGLITVLIVFVQARIAYLQLGFLFLLISFVHARKLLNFGYMGLVCALLIGLFLSSGVELPGRLGQTFTLDFLTNHIEAIWGGGDASTSAAAEGVDLRLGWWTQIDERLHESLSTWVFGLGYGLPLTSFRGPDDDIVREPHNSFVSIYGRLGVAGICLFLIVQSIILQKCLRLVLLTRARGDFRVNLCSATILCFFGVSLIYSMGEGGLEVSFIAVPYYFFAGVVIALERIYRDAAYVLAIDHRR